MIKTISKSISRKLMLIVLSTTFLALLVAATAMLMYEVHSYRAAWLNELTVQADILARVGAPALDFNDQKSAREDLEQLKARENILAAAVYAEDGTLFATYVHDPHGQFDFPPDPKRTGHTVQGEEIAAFKQIHRRGSTIGTIYLLARFPLLNRISTYLTILLGVMTASLLLATMISLWFQRAIITPILQLTSAAGDVIRQRDFSVKVNKSTEDEIGVLVDAFNRLLGEVGERTKALQDSNVTLQYEMEVRRDAEKRLQHLNATLEESIAARTAQLNAANEQLRQAQKMEAVGQLTGGIAHDFNNLLAAMQGNVELMQIRIAQGRGTDLQRYLTAVMASIDKAAALTHRLLAFSRRQTLAPKPTDINHLILSLQELIQRTAGPEIQMLTHLAEPLWMALCDPHQLENALLNLCINARDAMPNGGKLIIKTGNTGAVDAGSNAGDNAIEYVTVSITDTGTGMTPEVLARAFDPFFTTKPLGQGTGLGLSMVYGFAHQSGGLVGIESAPGKGTTVHLQLPRFAGKTEVAVPDDALPSTPRAAKAATILVVDDEAPIRTNIAEFLTELGHTVVQAADGHAALHVLQSMESIDLLVTDVGLPNGMNGKQLADTAHAMHPSLKVLFITGYAEASTAGKSLHSAGREVMTKPFRIEMFAEKVNAMIDTANSLAQQ